MLQLSDFERALFRSHDSMRSGRALRRFRSDRKSENASIQRIIAWLERAPPPRRRAIPAETRRARLTYAVKKPNCGVKRHRRHVDTCLSDVITSWRAFRRRPRLGAHQSGRLDGLKRIRPNLMSWSMAGSKKVDQLFRDPLQSPHKPRFTPRVASAAKLYRIKVFRAGWMSIETVAAAKDL